MGEESDANDVSDKNDMKAVNDINEETGNEKLEESISENQFDACLKDRLSPETDTIKNLSNSLQDEQKNEQINVRVDADKHISTGATVNPTESIDIDLTDPAVEAAATKI